jgi:hypothetical protein
LAFQTSSVLVIKSTLSYALNWIDLTLAIVVQKVTSLTLGAFIVANINQTVLNLDLSAKKSWLQNLVICLLIVMIRLNFLIIIFSLDLKILLYIIIGVNQKTSFAFLASFETKIRAIKLFYKIHTHASLSV